MAGHRERGRSASKIVPHSLSQKQINAANSVTGYKVQFTLCRDPMQPGIFFGIFLGYLGDQSSIEQRGWPSPFYDWLQMMHGV